MNDIDNQIENIVSTSPAVNQQHAEDNISSATNDVTTKQYGIGLDIQDSPIFQEQAKTTDAGIDLSASGDPLVTGTALPNNTYNTSFVKEKEGSPLYFQTGVYDAMPWADLEKAETDTLAKQKQIYLAMGANARPDDYIGYMPLPEEANLSWWSHTVGSVENSIMDLVPVTLPKFAAGTLNAATKLTTGLLSYPLKLAYTAQPDTAFGRWAKSVDERFDDINERSNALNDMIDAAVSPIEKVTAARYQADLTDPSLKAQIGRAFGPGITMFGLGIASRRPDLAAAIFNFSQSNSLRHKALDAGVSSSVADMYSVGVPFASSLLDNVQILGTMGVMTLTYKASKDVLKDMTKSGLIKFAKTAGHETAEIGAEAGIEMVQTVMEGVYDPEFLESPVDQLTVAAITAAALRGVGVPASVRHAKAEQREELAKAAGVLAQYNELRQAALNITNELATKGVIDESKKAEVADYLISVAPDTLIENLRLGIKGDLDAIPEKNRAQMLPLLNAIKDSYGSEVFSPRMFQIIDNTVETNLSDLRGGLSDAEVQMIKGLIRGGYVVATIAHRSDKNYKGFQVPTFVVTNNKEGSSYYSRSKNEIGIHSSRSNTENNNISPMFADMIQQGFVRSSALSDKLASIIHEMGHWLDAEVGSKGYSEFLQYYYGNISKVFGKEKAAAIKGATFGGKAVSNRMPGVSMANYTAERNATEYNAQALARLGKRAAEYFGLGRSKANKFLSYANIMLNQLANVEGPNGEKLYKDIYDFQTALQDVTKQNMAKLADLIDAFGSDNIKDALHKFMGDGEDFADFAEYLASKGMLRELYDVMDSFADAAGIQKINDLFDGNQQAIDNFVTAGDYMFKDGYDTAVDEIRTRRAEAKAKKDGKVPVDAIVDPNALPTPQGVVVADTTSDTIDSADMPTWFSDETENKERFWSNGKYHLEGNEKISEQSKETQEAVKKLANKYLVDAEGFMIPELDNYGVSSPNDIVELTGDELVDVLNKRNDLDQSLTKKQLGNYSLGYWGDLLSSDYYGEEGTQYETQDWAKAAKDAKQSIKQSVEKGKQPKKQISADTQINGQNLMQDIDMVNTGLNQRLANPMNKVVKWAASSKWGWGLDRILVTLMGRDAAEKLNVAGRYSAKQAIRSKYWDEFSARLEPIFKTGKDKAKFAFQYKTITTDLGFVRMNNVEMINPANPNLISKRNITGWEAAYVYLMARQGYADRVQKSTTTNINDIIKLLSDDEKKFADAMSAQLMDMYTKTFGKSKYANYFPILSAEHELFNELSIDSLTARQDTDDAIAIVDAGRIFSQYLSRWASHESGYFQTIKRVRDIFGYTGVDKSEMGPDYVFNAEEDEARIRASAQIAAITKEILGGDGYNNIMNIVTQQLSDKQEQMFDASRNNTLTQIGNNVIKSILANKIISLPKNAVNLFMMWGGAQNQSLYWNSFAEGFGDMSGTFDYMMKHSKEIKQRWGAAGGINEYLDQRTLGGNTAPAMKQLAKIFSQIEWTGDKTQNMAKFSAAMDMMGDAGLKLFMQSGDMFANVFGGYGLIKDYLAQGMTEEEAFSKLDRYIIEHQSSSNLAMKPLVQTENIRNVLGQIFAYTSEGVAKWASILGTFDEVKMGTATKSQAIANAVSIAISMALYSALAAGAWDLFDDDDKIREETEKALVNTAIDQVFGGLVAGNAMITPAVSYLIGDTRIGGMSVPLYNYAVDGITSLKKGEYDKVAVKIQSVLGLPIGADNIWNSLLGVSLLTDPNPDVRYAGKLMVLGYTGNRAAKRAGIKKETVEKNNEE